MCAWNTFLNSVRDAESDLGSPSAVWYRGQSNAEWGLTPSLHRVQNWQEKEHALFIEFSNTASRLFEKRSNDWETLFDMQHYWIPTRLLDWTTVMGVALAFILHSDYTNNCDSALYLLNPLDLNGSSGRRNIIQLPEDISFDYKSMYWENIPVQIEKPIAIRPAHISDRLRAQQETFTVHGSDPNGFSKVEKSFRKVVLPKEAKAEAREFLRWANLNEYTLYPDIVGMAGHIKQKIL